MITFETEVRIERPIEEVFAYVSEPLNFPHWNSAVGAVRGISDGSDGVSSRYEMERELPTGRAVNELEVMAREQPVEFAIRALSGPTPFLYRYRFTADEGETILHLDADVELNSVAAFLPQLVGRAVKKGVDDNLASLKEILESRLA